MSQTVVRSMLLVALLVASVGTLAAQTRIRVVEEDGYRVKVEPIVEDSTAS